MATIPIKQKQCPAIHGINSLIQTAKAIRLLNERLMAREQYSRAMQYFRRMRWLIANKLIPVQGRTDKQLAEAI